MKLIAFGHRARVGKDMACQFVLQEYNAYRNSFAMKLKEVCADIYGWAGMKQPSYYEAHPEFKDIVLSKIDMTPRELLVKFGTEAVRNNVFEDTWVEIMRDKMTYMARHSSAIQLISDMRFPNEKKMVKDLGGYCVRIDRPDVAVLDDEADNALAGDDDWDAIIVNDGTIEQFRDKVRAVVEDLLL